MPPLTIPPNPQRPPATSSHPRPRYQRPERAESTVQEIPVSGPQASSGQPPQPVEHLEGRAQAAGDARKKPPASPFPRDRPTHAAVWCGAVLCIVFSLLLILAGVLTLVVFLVIRPRHPEFDTPGATLNNIYIDSPQYYNGDLTFLANFSNPNKKIDVRFEYVAVELYFRNTLVAVQALQPFSQRRGEVRLESVHMVSSEVYLSPELVREMETEVGGNTVVYSIRGTFKVRGSLGIIHFTYWLYGRCTVALTRPPSGVLVARTCRTRR